jgi:hypothetical protein
MNNAFNCLGVASAPSATPQRPIETTQTAPTDQRRPQEQQQRIVVTQGSTLQKHRIAFTYVVHQDCSSTELPLVQVVERPINGRVAVERGTGQVDFPKDNPRSACKGRITNGVVVSYEPDPRFIGLDVITIKVVFPAGNSLQRRYTVEVRRGGAVSSLPNNPIN